MEAGGGVAWNCLRIAIMAVRILQKSQEHGKSRTNTDTGKEREYKSRENAIK
ncbi:hypothetical protein Tco_0315325, partial [Tanacetum coccineum]